MRENVASRPGDVWILGDHRLMCGDALRAADWRRLLGFEPDVLADMRVVDAVITSPPYADKREYDPGSGFAPIDPDAYVAWYGPVAKNIRTFLASHGSYFLNIRAACDEGERFLYVYDLVLAHKRRWGFRFVDDFVWVHGGTPKTVQKRFKNQWEGIYQFTVAEDHKFHPENVMQAAKSVWPRPGDDLASGDGETSGRHPSQADGTAMHAVRHGHGRVVKVRKPAILRGRGGGAVPKKGVPVGGISTTDGLAYPGNVLSFGVNREALGHPAQFPETLPTHFIKAYTSKGDLICDPFAGVGTTLIAAEQLGRRFVGLEISPAYVDVAVHRWERRTGRKATRQIASEEISTAQLFPQRRRA